MCTQDGSINWDQVTELASLELLFHLHTKGDHGGGIAWDCVTDKMKKKGVDILSMLDPIDLCAMTKMNKTNAMTNKT